MLSPKRLNPFAKSVASITNADLSKPLVEPTTSEKLFFPIFESRGSIIFWICYVLFFSIFALASSLVWLDTWWNIFVYFLNVFLTIGLIILFTVGYIHIYRDKIAQMPRQAIIKNIVIAELLLVPAATVLTAILKYILVSVETPINDLVEFIFTNTLMSLAMTLLFMYYFTSQYDSVRLHQAQFQQQLIEQNEQLKARITPHFFFNMLNTMQYLIETDQQEAEKMLRNVSTLYRASFDDTREVALLDEIELCERYLAIEKYRFEDRLNVIWELPDEDLMYDMVIPSLTLQLVIEKMIVLVVELTNETIDLKILIEWIDDIVTIEVSVNVPTAAYAQIIQNIEKNLSFDNQTEVLRHYYGKAAYIAYKYWIGQVTTYIHYPLKDVAY